jgi:3'-phosphoadenosine 5'-phosphosulfate (PAPS) 3'-phosphatase
MAKKDFTAKGQSILGNKPKSMDDFFSDEAPQPPQPSTATPVTQDDVKLENQQTVKPSKQENIKTVPAQVEEERTERYEWRHTPTMQERIQRYLLKRNKNRKAKESKVKMVDVLEEAVDAYLKREDF